jgi:lipopolysaccharide/colanic/teichoic acid biosynthesis glycosyltransferase
MFQQESEKTKTGSDEGSSSDRGRPFWKVCLDFVLILLLLPAVLFFALFLSLVIKLGSPGPILFRQKRIGYKGREFTCFKFRTMTVDADVSQHRKHAQQLIGSEAPMVKLDAHSDPRLIPFGSKMRATGLDELPQLINVLRGEMSLVGPRPCIPYEFEVYAPWQKHRFDAVPGLTGLWQVSGKNRTTFNQMINLDIEYARRQNLWLDLKIILMTVPALVTQCLDMRAARKAKVSASKPSSVPHIGKSVPFYHL